MTSGTYRYDADLDSDRKWPAYFDGKAIWAEWNNNRLFTVQMNEDGTQLHRHQPVPAQPADAAARTRLQFGPDGALYMIEWGSGFGGNNADSGIYRIDYVEGNRAPIARAHDQPDVRSGPADGAVRRRGIVRPGHGEPGPHLRVGLHGDGTTDATDADRDATPTPRRATTRPG